MDIRNYQRVHRTLVWANRFAASTSFGSNKLLYYMGGVDNWLFPTYNITTPVAFDQNYAFQTLATNMRGFPQNIRNGNSFFVYNTELRWPVFRYLFNRPIRSDFINNFQLVLFGDVGTAWTGTSPWSEDNQLSTQYIYRNPLFIKVEMQKDPLVEGFGFGARTRLFGYFLRGDLAWGVEDGRIGKPIFYFSLSLDF
jgi:outer membrane protein assembly factor BamA